LNDLQTVQSNAMTIPEDLSENYFQYCFRARQRR